MKYHCDRSAERNLGAVSPNAERVSRAPNVGRLTASLLAALAELGWTAPPSGGDILEALQNGEALTTQQAAMICDVSDQTIRDWIEHANSLGKPIAIKRTTWIVGRPHLFAYIEEHGGGLHERVKAERRFESYWPRWSQAQGPRTV
ncbi:hypothetical protein [Bradyrhizobium sp. SZCCHNR3118]|uniref:hypothetical protein n=1 Tax=Bradyrhizobium sp. SZCCHNR3118 TaxID=3057468 RepID=UPI002916D2B4|nr:hypothetical protein [Bradyrhizobium sp. SZCCHNR3118]